MIQLRMLGALHLTDADGRELHALLAQPRRLALLVYLAATAPRDLHRRDHLLALFWPELDQAHARAALRQSLHVLRDTLGPDVILTRGDEALGLDPARIRCDVVEFKRAAHGDRPTDALDLYRGDLLEGFYIRGAPAFEQWLEDERAGLRADALRCATALMDRCDKGGRLTESAQLVRRALQISPLDEPMLRRLMKALDRLGDRAGALDAYDGFAKRLAADLESAPAPETQALANAVRARVMPLASADTGLPPLEVPMSLPLPPHPSAKPRRWLRAAAAVFGLAVVIAALTLGTHEPTQLNAKRVLVVPFANRTGDPALDPLGNLAADWITRGLAMTEVLEVADPSAMLLEGGGRPSGRESADPRKLARASGAGLVVSGATYLRGDQIEFGAQITDVRSGSVLRPLAPVLGDRSEPRAALSMLREHIMSALAEAVDTRLGPLASPGDPPRYDAYVAFKTGVQLWYAERNAPAAVSSFTRAAALDSTYALPLIWAAWAHAGTMLDRCDSTEAIAQRLAGMRVTALEQTQLDRVRARCRGDLPAAYRLGQTLVEAVPGSELMWEQLARDALDFDRPQEAADILERLHPNGGALRGRVSYYSWLTAAYHQLGQHQRELDAAERARDRFPAHLAALRMELLALAALGRGPEVTARLDEIDVLPPDPSRKPATVLREIALDLAAHGDSAAARIALNHTLVWLASRPAAEQATEYLRRERALTHYAVGHADSARAFAVALARAHPRNPVYAGLLGVLAAQRGDGAEAARLDRLLVGLERPYGRGQVSYWRACIAATLGHREEAVDLLTHALAEGYVFKDLLFLGAHVEPSFAALRQYPPFQQLLRPKG